MAQTALELGKYNSKYFFFFIQLYKGTIKVSRKISRSQHQALLVHCLKCTDKHNLKVLSINKLNFEINFSHVILFIYVCAMKLNKQDCTEMVQIAFEKGDT